MENSKELLVGMLVFVAIAVTIAAIFTFGDVGMARNNYTLKIKFSDVNNLENGTPVILNGVKIGKVQDIYIEGEEVIVEASIKKSILIRKGARFTINLKGVIGDLNLKVYNTGKGNQYYKDGDSVQGEDPISLDIMLEKGYELMVMMEDVNKSLKDLDLKESVKDSQEILRNVRRSSEKMAGTIDNANKLMTNANKLIVENREDLKESVKTGKELIAKMDKLVDKNEKDINFIVENLKTVVTDMKSMLETNKGSIEKSVKSFEKITEKTAAILETMDPKEVKELKDNLLIISRDIKEITKRLNEATAPEKTKALKESMNKIVKNSEKVKAIIDNKLELEAQVEIDSDEKFAGNGRFKLTNRQSNIYVKIEKNNVDKDMGVNSLTIGKQGEKISYGGGVIRDRAGVEAAYKINKRVSLTGEYYDFKNGQSFIGADYELNKFRLYFRYDLGEYYRAGVGYKF